MLLLVSSAALSLALLDLPGFFISSDTLLPASFVWDALNHDYAWSGFQQARVPSFFPDMLLYGAVQIGSGSWRLAMAVWVFVMVGWLLTLGGWIVARIARPASATAPLCFVLLSLAVLTGAMLGFPRFAAEADSTGYFFPYLFVLLLFTHGGPFLLALTAAAVASREAERSPGPRTLALAGLTWAAALSDMLCFVSLLVPLTAALLASWMVAATPRRTVVRLLSAAWGAGALGWASAQWLNRQPVPFPRPSDLPSHVARFVADAPNHPGMALAMLVLVLVLVADGWRRGWRGWLGDFWPVFATTSALASLALTILLYEEIWSYRYAFPFLWWTIFMAAALLARRLTRPVLPRIALACLAAALLFVFSTRGWHVPGVLTWKSALANCLHQQGLRAGLAEYWSARSTSAASDWQLQVDQVTRDGRAFYWGNDRYWFIHDVHDTSALPPYRFIVMHGLDEPVIKQRYGAPDRIVDCGGTAVWVYDDPARVREVLARHSAELFATFAPKR
jgi:hypothetical protein